jgi:hypothetical protein
MSISKIGKSLLSVCFNFAFLAALGLTPLVSEEFVLTVSQERAKIIEEIVVTMGETSVPMLVFKKSHLEDLSKKLKGMGSFNFLGYIFTHPELKEHMKEIADSSWKFNGIMKSIRKGFDRDKAAGTIWEQIPGFARFLGVTEERLILFAEESEWDELVQYLVKHVR